ncbi:MAG: phosphoglucomutase/phosphomannomutase family protein [Clostridia bacterium]|nr:phosphoglucomutase/phosphomannomutase family protein [Clostridia bacterium]
MKKINFGTGGFRAIIGEDFNKENVQGIAQAVANLINKKNLKKEICIGYDHRFMSENFAVWCAEVMAGNGIRVELFDSATSTPVVMFASKIKENDYGMMITASHNPYIYNGVKVFVAEGKDASNEETGEIEREMEKISQIKTISFNEAKDKQIFLVNYMEEYIDNIVALLDLNGIGGDISVVYDAMHGSTVEELDMMSKKIGITNFETINDKRDAFFGFKVPAPSEKNIDDLRNAVLNKRASIGFALDADGDRLAVVDEKGNYIDNNYILAITYYFFVKYCGKKGNSVKNVATSNLLNAVTEKLGYVCKEVPVGFKYVSSALREDNSVVGGESSGGLAIEGHIWGKDSLLAIAVCLKAMIVMKKSFSEILQEVKDFVGGYEKIIYDKQYSYTKEHKEFIDKTLYQDKKMPQHKYQLDHVVYEDYVKVYYKNGNWSLIRFSGTEPILRIFVEADSKQECESMVKDWEELLKL